MPLSLAPERRECFAQRRRASLAAASCCWITAKKPGRKILMSGGGRCNFTNMYVETGGLFEPKTPHFCKSALARYTQWDFIELVGKYGIAWHEKTLGQLFLR
ncbi:oxidoreductase [Klebsiella pneumoniae subsp. ozaenae]|uniref:Oxidoreductase n=1 Tax=Klebsiella pneumoniae subsp. ozaenae TaxID=574 RepID=A0A378AMX7_KLEPO|nr:oxidoreductase [Klebsiella pneumoniae subsp. ozaenae]